MKHSLSLFFLLFMTMAFGWSVSSCNDELATGSSDQPYLSVDTLQLGQLLAGNSSKTYQLRIINPCSKEIRLTSVALRYGGESGFRMNVDGMNGTSFSDADLLRIASHDSLFVFVEATFPETGGGLTDYIDYIDVMCNGVQQSVVLTAQSKDVLKLYAETLTSDQVWQRTQEVQIYDSLVIEEGATLTLADSVTLYLHDKANIIVRGKLLCLGKLGAPVTIRGDRTDNMFPNLPYDNLPSQWGSIYFDRRSHGSSFEFADIHGMSTGIYVDSTDVSFRNCHIKNSDDNLLTGYMATIVLENCELSNAAGALFEAFGGWHEVTHCTLANYNFAAAIKQRAVHISNVMPDVAYTPLYRCNFTNTIVWGDTYDPDVFPEYYKVVESEDAKGNPVYADSVFCYRFDHCLLRADGYDDADFIQIQWNKDPLYRLIDDANYIYDFHLQDESPAKWTGVKTAIQYDLDGVLRPDAPSIGCYEFVPAP